MKQTIFLIAWLVVISFCSCKDNSIIEGDNIVRVDGQDRDLDSITGDNYVYHLPIIFHVFYQNSSDTTQYIPQARLATILANVNELYRGDVYNRNLDTIPSENIHVQFELALKDEQDRTLATPGVEYIPYPDGVDSINYKTFMNDRTQKYQKYLWDPNDYINVMVYKFGDDDQESTTLGISSMPYKVGNYPDIEGLKSNRYYPMKKENLNFAYCISINSEYVDAKYEGTRYTTDKDSLNYVYNSSDVNATLAHELGHYLGLRHAFSENSTQDGTEMADNDNDTDYCTDTPSYNRNEYEKWLINFLKENRDKKYSLRDVVVRSNSRGEKWLADNMMDYVACLNMRFTPQQFHRMRRVLYYAPLIPGPKIKRIGTRAIETYDGVIEDLPIVLSKPRTINKNIPEIRISK